MIGGDDVDLSDIGLMLPKKALLASIEVIKKFWPECTIQFADEQLFNAPGEDEHTHEVFVFKNKQFEESWDKYGAVEENNHTMFYLLSGNSSTEGFSMTCVVTDRYETETHAILAAMESVLKP